MPSRAASGATSEAELLLACVRRHVSAAPIDEVNALCARRVRWEHVLALAARHRVTPLVAASLKAVDRSLLPADLPAHLERVQRVNAARNLRMTAFAHGIAQRLDGAGIGSLCFKGPTLAVQAYGSLALRMFDDLDILVRPRDAEQAWAVLATSGFRSDVAATPAHRRALAALQRPVTFVNDDERVTIDLHTAITPGYQPLRIDAAHVIDESVAIDVQGRPLRTLPAEMLLVLLGAHGAKHLWERLAWVADIAALVHRRRDLDWDRVDALARAWHCRRTLQVACELAARVLRVPVPDALQGRAATQRQIAALVDRAADRLLEPGHAPPSTIDLARFHLGAMDRWRDRGRYVAAMLRPSEADAAAADERLPGRLWRYPRRIVRLLVRGHASPSLVKPAQDR